MSLSRFALVAALFVSAARCTSHVAANDYGCVFNADCEAGLVCAAHACRATCRTDRDCATNTRCLRGDDGLSSACVPNPPAAVACGRDADCPAGNACLSGVCRALCQQDYDCRVVNPLTACVSGMCVSTCNAPNSVCGVTCTNLQTDPANCGACGTACPSGACAGGACVAVCASPRRMCGSTCVDVTSDVTNCGACGTSCGAGLCVEGACMSRCPSPRRMCGSACLDVSTDVANCGACGMACLAVPNGSARCVAGACGAVCNDGFYLREGRCVVVPAPSPAGAPSGATATSRRPVFRWTNPAGGGDGARVQVCRDRACTMEVARFEATGTSASPSADLAPGVYFWRVFGRAGTSVGTTASSVVREIVIPARSAARNDAWGTYPDFNGDGIADALIAEQGRSRVMFYPGSTGGLADAPAQTLSPIEVCGFGSDVATAGDVDGDGFVDAVVGSPDESSVYVYYGTAAGLTPTGTRVTYDSFGFGSVVRAAGDVNGDGFADLLVWGGGEVSVAYYILGAARSTPMRAVPIDGIRPAGAWSIAGVGHLNDDAYDDVVIAVPGAGDLLPSIKVFYGSATGLPSEPSASLSVNAAAISGAGDFDGDGYADVVVGGAGGLGIAWVYTGSATGLSSEPTFTPVSYTHLTLPTTSRV